jgi:hypothetical protein
VATKSRKKASKAAAKKPAASKQAGRSAAPARKDVKGAKPAKPEGKGAAGRKIKCCQHCPDFEYCQEKGECCDYCDFYLNGKCTYGKKKGLPSVNQEIELPDYRGDDYGIDDYEAYEPVYE